jgi:hypothetical protein
MTSCASKPVKIQTTVSAECKTIPPITYAYSEVLCATDPQNQCDTWETVKKIMADNAAKASLCAKV